MLSILISCMRSFHGKQPSYESFTGCVFDTRNFLPPSMNSVEPQPFCVMSRDRWKNHRPTLNSRERNRSRLNRHGESALHSRKTGDVLVGNSIQMPRWICEPLTS